MELPAYSPPSVSVKSGLYWLSLTACQMEQEDLRHRIKKLFKVRDFFKNYLFFKINHFHFLCQSIDVDMRGAVGFLSLQEGLKKLTQLKPQIHLSRPAF